MQQFSINCCIFIIYYTHFFIKVKNLFFNYYEICFSQLRKAYILANARKYYNAVVRNYNNKVQMFPSSIIASMFKFTKKQMFAVENEAEREAVKVEF